MYVDDNSARVIVPLWRVVFVGQRHALPLGHHFGGGISPGRGETGRSADGHGIARGLGPETAAPDEDRRRGRFHAGKTHGPLDRTPAYRTRRARQSGFQYGLVTEGHVTVNVVIRMIVERFPVDAAGQHGPGPVTGADGLEPVTTVLIAVAVLSLPARVPGLAGEHGYTDGRTRQLQHDKTLHCCSRYRISSRTDLRSWVCTRDDTSA